MARLLLTSLLIVSLSINGIITQNLFGYEMLQNLVRESDNNLFFSPFGVEATMKMLMSAARGQTQDKIRALFFLTFAESIDAPTAEEELLKMKNRMESIQKNNNEDTTFKSANKMLVKKSFPINKEFANTVRDVFKGEIEEVNFAYPNLTRQVNNWVSDATNGKIVKLVDDISPEALMMVLNAAYFKGKWKNPFPYDPNNKLQANFTSNGFGKPINIDFMRMNGNFKYFEDERFKMIQLPLSDGYNFYLMVPTENDETIDNLIDNLNFNDVKDALAEMKTSDPKNINLWMPKFKLESDYDLKEALQAMGFGDMYDYSADFSGINGQKNLKLSSIIHKAYTDINEGGAEVPLPPITGAKVVPTPGGPKSMEFKVNKPFAFFIMDSSSQIAFIGRVNSLVNEQQLGLNLL